MSAVLYSASENSASLQSTTVGGTKPLHRFIKGQPKPVGISVLILGSSYIIIAITVIASLSSVHMLGTMPVLVLGVLFTVCGILYIITEHNPTKKMVTISLALSIITVLGSVWNLLQVIPDVISGHYRNFYFHEEGLMEDDILWEAAYVDMGHAMDWLFLVYGLMGGITVLVMSVFAGAALRSSKNQALVVMNTTPAETPAGQQAQEDGLNCEKMSTE